jgi:hypothetical protein
MHQKYLLLLANKDQYFVKLDLDVNGVTWNVTFAGVGNPLLF